ncbi:hypothetical protein, partial [Trichormus variabilis]|uniref:hypothetical protein n=1 Tax=Anabaena variabilis TaxID=264691 RepID=UPI001A7E3B06
GSDTLRAALRRAPLSGTYPIYPTYSPLSTLFSKIFSPFICCRYKAYGVGILGYSIPESC